MINNSYILKEKYMFNKISIGCALAVILSFSFQSSAHSIPTKWEKVEASLSDLLNSGWLLTGISSNRVAYRNSIGPGGLDEETYVFSLTKDGKYIICSMDNPNPPIAKVAGCRRIN
jgi:hypothetical protein